MRLDRFEIEIDEGKGEMVKISALWIEALAAGPSKGSVDPNEIDETSSRSKLYEADLIDSPLHTTAQDGLVKRNGACRIRDAKNDMVETAETDGGG